MLARVEEGIDHADSPSSRMSVRQTGPQALILGAGMGRSVYSISRDRIGVSSIIAANSNISMSAMPPAAWRASR